MLAIWQEYKYFLLPPIILAAVCILLDFNGLYGQDAHEYYRYTKDLYNSLQTGKPKSDYFWGVGYPLAGVIFSFFTKNVLFSLQAISLLCYTFVGILLYKSAKYLYDFKHLPAYFPKLAIFLLYFSAPYLIRLGTLVMSDMLATLGLILCFYGMTAYYYTQKNSFIYIAVAGATFSILTRYPPAVVVLPMLLALIFWVFKQKKYVVFLFSTLIALIGLACHIYIKKENLFAFTNHGSLYGWTLLNSFRRVLHSPDGLQYCTFPNILYVFGQFWHPYYLGLTGLLVFFIRKKELTQIPIKIVIVSILLYSIFLAGIPFQNMRFLLLSFPLASLLLMPALGRFYLFITAYNKKYFSLIILGLFLFQSLFTAKSLRDLIVRNQWEQQVSRDLQAYKGLTLYTFDINVALGSYPIPLKIEDTWKSKIDSFEIGALYFCEEKKLESQWVGRNPLINWQKVKKNYSLILEKEYENGWKLYKIAPLSKSL